jgi:hypothetical protein
MFAYNPLAPTAEGRLTAALEKTFLRKEGPVGRC